MMASTRKSIALLILTVAGTWGLLLVRDELVQAISTPWASVDYLDTQLKYQLLTLGLVVVYLPLSFWLKPRTFPAYFRVGDIDAPANTNRLFGIKNGESWRRIGVRFSVIVTLVTAAIIYFQVFSSDSVSLGLVLLWVPLLAASNAFVEEALTRFGVITALDGVLKPNSIAVVSGFVFGTVHYFGTPSGLVGVIVAGLLGWLLARSVLETKGLFWAWFIHFLQDVIIIGALLTV